MVRGVSLGHQLPELCEGRPGEGTQAKGTLPSTGCGDPGVPGESLLLGACGRRRGKCKERR